jgi:hypothetical protein
MGETTKGHCPNCRAERNAEIVAEDSFEGTDEDSGIWSGSSYAILRCLGCDNRYFRQLSSCSEEADMETGEITPETTYYPSPVSPVHRRRPQWLWFGFEMDHPALSALLEELYTALDADLRVLATTGMRTVFDCACDVLGVDRNLTFADKLRELVRTGKIGVEEQEILGTLVEAGNGAAHRGWKPDAMQMQTLVQTLENFLERSFILKQDIQRLRNVIPART